MHHELVQRSQQGDHEAFGVLVQGAIARLYASARLILHDKDQADDAVQEALVEAWRDIRGLRDPARLDPWLHRLLVRSCYRVAKRERRRTIHQVPLAFDHDAPAPDGLASYVARDEVERAFTRLQQDHRVVLVLAYYADLSIEDIALALGIPVGTTKSRLHRATNSLRAALAAEDRAASFSTGRTV